MLNPNLFFKGGKSTHLFRTKNWGTSFYQKWCFLKSFDLKELEKTSTIKVIGSGVQVLPPTYKSRTRSIYCADDSHSVRNHYFINKAKNAFVIQHYFFGLSSVHFGLMWCQRHYFGVFLFFKHFSNMAVLQQLSLILFLLWGKIHIGKEHHMNHGLKYLRKGRNCYKRHS